jgi:hypothetical protein
MTNVGFGGSTYNSWFDYTNQILSSNVSVPARRVAANGKGPQLITRVNINVAGYTTTVTLKLYAGGKKTGTISRSADSTPGATGYADLTSALYISNGSTVAFGTSDNSDGLYFSRNGSGTTTISNGAGSWAGTIGGAYTYIESPTAPRTLTATSSTTQTGRVELSWLSPSDDGGSAVTIYNVYTLSGSTYTLLGSTAGTTYSATGLTANTSYNFVVRARNLVTDTAGTQSVDSNTATATAPYIAPPVTVPTAPQGLTATTSTTVIGAVELSWTVPTSDGGSAITNYYIYVNGVYQGALGGTSLASTPDYVVTGLTELATSSFTVAAVNVNGTGTVSSAVSGKASGNPTAPTNLTVTPDALTSGVLNLAWTAPADSGGTISGYRIYDANTDTLVVDQAGTGTTYSHTGRTVGTEYSYYVRAYNAIGIAQTPDQYGVASASAAETAITVSGAPSVVASTTVAGRLTVTWTANAGATSYTVTNKNTGVSVVVSANITTFVADNLTAGTEYGFTKTPNGGSESDIGYGTPLDTSIQTLAASTAITNATNTELSTATATITSVQSDSFTYAKTVTNLDETQVSAESGSAVVTNKTNQDLADSDGIITDTIDSVTIVSPFTFTYLRSGTLLEATPSSGIVVGNLTNAELNTLGASVTVPGASTDTFTYTTTTYTGGALDIASGGTTTNLSQTSFNVTQGPITAVTDYTLSYAKVATSQEASAATGTIVNTTNQQIFNKNIGNDVVRVVPDYKTIKYPVVGGLKAAISATEQATTVVTVTTVADHYFQSGDTVTIQGSTNGSGVFNGQWTINPPASATLTARSGYTVTVTTGTAHGLTTGDSFVLAGSTNGSGVLNGTWVVLAGGLTTTVLTFTHTATGTITSAADTSATVTATRKFRFTRTTATIASAADTAATADVDVSVKTVANPTDSVTRVTSDSDTKMEVIYRSGWIG